MSRSRYQCLVVGLEIVDHLPSLVVPDLSVQLVWTLPLPRQNPDGDVRSLRSCSPTSVLLCLLHDRLHCLMLWSQGTSLPTISFYKLTSPTQRQTPLPSRLKSWVLLNSDFSIAGQRIFALPNIFRSVLRRTRGQISARAPAAQVHDSPERLVGVFSFLLSITTIPHEFPHIGPNYAGERLEISRITAVCDGGGGGGGLVFAVRKRIEAGLQFVGLIGVSIYDGHARRHPNPMQMITHPLFP
ncbi:hypothetical protein HYC85_012138 [Camellia sinensis]|uniref:Uncharacterized protein n=1 Tax=Camellia sinensis TaxID=4442 RepID=A0A7J7HBZ3_CAMSI|nr:hypothetical protein HYC85_012138 [Camellia sinensis]